MSINTVGNASGEKGVRIGIPLKDLVSIWTYAPFQHVEVSWHHVVGQYTFHMNSVLWSTNGLLQTIYSRSYRVIWLFHCFSQSLQSQKQQVIKHFIMWIYICTEELIDNYFPKHYWILYFPFLFLFTPHLFNYLLFMIRELSLEGFPNRYVLSTLVRTQKSVLLYSQ